MAETVEGGCRCGQVRFRVSAPPLLTMACHCRGCQQMTASAFSLSAVYPAEAFEVVTGEPVLGGLHGPTRHFFCPHCKSWMFTRPETAEWIVAVRATLLDDPHDFEPFVETFTDEKLPWAATGALRSFPRFPEFEEYAGLTAAYQAHVAKAPRG